jgi:hypothetical protein
MPAKSSAGACRVRISAPLLILLLISALSVMGLSAGLALAGGGGASAGAGSEKQAAPGQPDLARGSRIPWQDGSYFLAGINYPQYQYYGGDIATLSSVDPDCNWAYSSSFDYVAAEIDGVLARVVCITGDAREDHPAAARNRSPAAELASIV